MRSGGLNSPISPSAWNRGRPPDIATRYDGSISGSDRGNGEGAGRSRAAVPVVGIALVVAITVVLSAIVGGFVIALPDSESPALQASLSVAVDTGADKIRIEHESGDALYSDRTRIVWEINESTYRSHPTDAREGMQSSQYATFTFDGSGNSTGVWTNYPSPGNHSIEGSHVITVTVYNTKSGNRVYTDTFGAHEVQAEL